MGDFLNVVTLGVVLVVGYFAGLFSAFAAIRLAPWIAAIQASRGTSRKISYNDDERAADFDDRRNNSNRPIHAPMQAPIPRR